LQEWKIKAFYEGKQQAKSMIDTYTHACKVNRNHYSLILQNEARHAINWHRQLKWSGTYASRNYAYCETAGKALEFAQYLKEVK